MQEFWESSFIEMQTSWGFEPSDSAILAMEYFLQNKAKDILIPGIGYGRNAKIFVRNGFNVTGIEISKTAIALAKIQNELDIKIHNGSVCDMPFDKNLYDGIFCYALVHLLDSREREKFINDCYNQLKPNGDMIFTVVSEKAAMYGKGRKLSKNRFEVAKGLNVFFYNPDTVKREFGKYGLVDFIEIAEPVNATENEPQLKLIYVKCKRKIN
jgi:SAM-dependent methyltransferase